MPVFVYHESQGKPLLIKKINGSKLNEGFVYHLKFLGFIEIFCVYHYRMYINERGIIMEAVILEELKTSFPTTRAQQARLTELVNNFGTLLNDEFKFVVGDILCLAKLLYESGDRRIVRSIRRQILDLEDAHEDNLEYLKKLEYLTECLTGFKPSIFRSIQVYFAELYHIDDSELIICLPKVTGQQGGAIVEIKRTPEDTNPIKFYVKTHREFRITTDPQFMMTADGTGKTDLKELFMYKVLEYIGYGPKTYFILGMDATLTQIEEGILIATQSLGYTKRPDERSKAFKIFEKTREELSGKPIESIAELTRRDIIAIDMLSRAFLLDDVMANQGNFGEITSSALFGSSAPSIKWKIVDFLPPKLVKQRGDDYSYRKHYPGGVSIFHSFKVGNVSHTYDEEELDIINSILAQENAQELWLPAIDKLTCGEEGKRYLSVTDALERAFADILNFMTENSKILKINPEKGRMKKRIKDLRDYKEKIMENFAELEQGVREHIAAQSSITPKPE